MSGKPFQQGRFEDLPELPRLAHKYFEAEKSVVKFTAPGFGETVAQIYKFGKGPPLFLIHGFMTSSYSWRYAFEGLGAKYTCYAIDLPGAGHTPHAPQASYAPDNLADWLAAAMKALGIFGCDVIGNSMGGYLAMRLALRHAGAINRLVNLHSPGIPELRLDLLNGFLFVPGMKAVLKAIIQMDPLRFVHKNVHYWDESLKSLEEAREYAAPLKTDGGADSLIKYFDETMNITAMRDFRQVLIKLPKFPVPLLLLYARKDPMVNPQFGTEFKKLIPDAKLVWLEEGSHFAHVDRVDLFLKPTLDFLAPE